MSGMVVFPARPARLVAQRRSRCWKCDGQMTRRPDARTCWWCPKCHHVVSYSSNKWTRLIESGQGPDGQLVD